LGSKTEQRGASSDSVIKGRKNKGTIRHLQRPAKKQRRYGVHEKKERNARTRAVLGDKRINTTDERTGDQERQRGRVIGINAK